MIRISKLAASVQPSATLAAGAKARLKVFGVSPRDGTTPTNWYYIDVRFG